MTWLVFALGLFAGIYTGSLFVRMKYAVRMASIMEEYRRNMDSLKRGHEFEKKVQDEVRRRLDRLLGDVMDEQKPH